MVYLELYFWNTAEKITSNFYDYMTCKSNSKIMIQNCLIFLTYEDQHQNNDIEPLEFPYIAFRNH